MTKTKYNSLIDKFNDLKKDRNYAEHIQDFDHVVELDDKLSAIMSIIDNTTIYFPTADCHKIVL